MMRYKWLSETSSTNDEVRGLPAGSVIAARAQTAGRGQRGNRWVSEAGQNLTFSMALEPSFLEAGEQFALSEAVSLAVCDTLAGFDIDAKVKWPNDIYVGTRKIAGILIENDIRGSRLGRSIVGVGLNVNQTVFPPEVPNPVSMSIAAARKFDLDMVLTTFLMAFKRRYALLEHGFSPHEEYVRRLWRRGAEAAFIADGVPFRGVIRTVLPTGELVIDEKTYLFKEVEFVI